MKYLICFLFFAFSFASVFAGETAENNFFAAQGLCDKNKQWKFKPECVAKHFTETKDGWDPLKTVAATAVSMGDCWPKMGMCHIKYCMDKGIKSPECNLKSLQPDKCAWNACCVTNRECAVNHNKCMGEKLGSKWEDFKKCCAGQ